MILICATILSAFAWLITLAAGTAVEKYKPKDSPWGALLQLAASIIIMIVVAVLFYKAGAA